MALTYLSGDRGEMPWWRWCWCVAPARGPTTSYAGRWCRKYSTSAAQQREECKKLYERRNCAAWSSTEAPPCMCSQLSAAWHEAASGLACQAGGRFVVSSARPPPASEKAALPVSHSFAPLTLITSSASPRHFVPPLPASCHFSVTLCPLNKGVLISS